MKAPLYNNTGKEAGTIELPTNIFDVKWNADMMHQVMMSLEGNARVSTAKVKDRGEVRGGGKKPWKQKGTGRARHGSRRSPIWIGGGVTHGPTNEKDYARKVNKSTRQKALLMALSQKLRDGKILFVDDITSTDGKTSGVAKMLKNFEKVDGFKTLTTKKANNALVLVPTLNGTTVRAFRNLPFAFAETIARTNPVSIMRYRYIVIAQPEKAIEILDVKVGKSASKAK